MMRTMTWKDVYDALFHFHTNIGNIVLFLWGGGVLHVS